MSPVVTGLVATSVPLFAMGLIASRRFRLAGAVVVLVGTAVTAFQLGIVALSDLWVVPNHVGMADTLGLLILWVLFGAVARAVGPMAIVGPPWVMAMVMGACLGEVPAAAILSTAAKSPGGAARLALCAAGGAMIGRMGDPAMLVLTNGHPDAMYAIAPLGLFLAWLARPQSGDVLASTPAGHLRLGFVLCIAIVAAIPGMTEAALVAGIVGLAFMMKGRRSALDVMTPAWQLLALAVALLTVVGGTPALAAESLAAVIEVLDWWAPPLMVMVTALLTALTDATAMSVIGAAIVDSPMSVDAERWVAPMAAGVAVGGLAPLIAAGAVRAGFKLWLLQIGVAVLWACCWGLS